MMNRISKLVAFYREPGGGVTW